MPFTYQKPSCTSCTPTAGDHESTRAIVGSGGGNGPGSVKKIVPSVRTARSLGACRGSGVR